MTPPSNANAGVERGEQCQAHVAVMIAITKLEQETGHMRQNFDQVTTASERLAEKIDQLAERVTAPEVTKTWIVAAFGIAGTLMTVGSGVLVAVISNSDKLAKLIGWGG